MYNKDDECLDFRWLSHKEWCKVEWNLYNLANKWRLLSRQIHSVMALMRHSETECVSLGVLVRSAKPHFWHAHDAHMICLIYSLPYPSVFYTAAWTMCGCYCRSYMYCQINSASVGLSHVTLFPFKYLNDLSFPTPASSKDEAHWKYRDIGLLLKFGKCLFYRKSSNHFLNATRL